MRGQTRLACHVLFGCVQLERQVSLLDNTGSDILRQRLLLLKGEWEDFKRERGKQVHNCID